VSPRERKLKEEWTASMASVFMPYAVPFETVYLVESSRLLPTGRFGEKVVIYFV
jgi:hypothetical protein